MWKTDGQPQQDISSRDLKTSWSCCHHTETVVRRLMWESYNIGVSGKMSAVKNNSCPKLRGTVRTHNVFIWVYSLAIRRPLSVQREPASRFLHNKLTTISDWAMWIRTAKDYSRILLLLSTEWYTYICLYLFLTYYLWNHNQVFKHSRDSRCLELLRRSCFYTSCLFGFVIRLM